MASINDIIDKTREYLTEDDLAKIQKAYVYAAKIHAGKYRLSGESYLSHPLAVADILATMRLDLSTIVSGLLHCVLHESTEASLEELKQLFGKDTANLVNSTTKLNKVKYNTTLDYQAENIRKMLLAMSSDIRVLLIKLAGRFHDMQSLKFFSKSKQLEIANETMDLYAPLASRLGIDWMKRELEDLAFAYIHPVEYTELTGKIAMSTFERQHYVDEVKKIISEELTEVEFSNFKILGRPKHLYSIYKKLIAQNIPLEKVYDKVAFRIILSSEGECYRALGIIHSLWSPVNGRFKDFISSPKANMYQSLHTSVIGPYGEFMEIQIRTREMDKVAKEGIAAHWAYKEGTRVSNKDASMFKWLKQLIQWLQDLKDPREFLDAVKDELHEDEVYVLTPKGEVKGFPMGSSPLDFAYSIHTEVGNRCVGAKVNGRIVPLKYQLQNGNLVEIVTSANQHPNRGWLTLVKTNRAKSRIKQWLNREEHEKSVKLGRDICDKELKKRNLSLKKILKTGHIKEILKSLQCNTLEILLQKVGSGKITIDAIANKMLPPESIKEPEDIETISALREKQFQQKKNKKKASKSIIEVDGLDDVLIRISHCCMPVPGDKITGFITAGRGIAIHKDSCPELLKSDPKRRVEVKWTTQQGSVHRAQIKIIAQDQKGLLANLSQLITTNDTNIINFEAHSAQDNTARINMTVEVKDITHLSVILQQVRQLDWVIEAYRK
jgi:GTP diphosphokinase / guanosine-3',5'-bis(diphosphate) 3'-diphosphatase